MNNILQSDKLDAIMQDIANIIFSKNMNDRITDLRSITHLTKYVAYHTPLYWKISARRDMEGAFSLGVFAQQTSTPIYKINIIRKDGPYINHPNHEATLYLYNGTLEELVMAMENARNDLQKMELLNE